MKKFPTMLIPLLAVTAFASGCVSTQPRYGSYSQSQGNVRSTPHRAIAVIESITRGRESNDSAFRRSNDDAYAIGLRFSNGGRETITQDNIGRLRIGDRVLLENGSLRKL